MVTTKNCPYCDELISINAIKCKHCGSMLITSPNPAEYIDPFTYTKMSLASRYEILNEIGRGGMATVYKAIQKNLQRTVALKVIHQNLVHDTEFLRRFHSEARMAASLNHPNIVSIYDDGIENNVHYISMEYLDGEDLHHIIKTRGKISVEQTVKIISCTADSLDYIHKRGLIHRDIKSSNIIVTKEGRAVLTDFGIARAVNSSKLSQTGSVLGTPEYMSPEQADGLDVDARSDLYSLGIVMYECLAGNVPFTGENPVSTIYKIINTPPPPIITYNRNIPSWLQTIVQIALAKNPQNRFTSGKEFSTALKEKKKIRTFERSKLNKHTQKVELKESRNRFSKKEINKKIVRKDTFSNRDTLKSTNNTKIIYVIGSVIVILLLVIAAMLLKDLNFSSNSLADENKDEQWVTLKDSEREEVLSLLSSGDILYQRHNLLEPTANNAYDKYKNVLRIHASNTHALVQLNKIFKEILDQANNYLRNGNNQEANTLIELLRQKFPDRDSDIKSFLENNEVSKLINNAQQMLSKTDLSLEELNQIFSNISKILSIDPENVSADNIKYDLEKRYEKLGEIYYSTHQYQYALQVYQQASQRFINNEFFLNSAADCRRKIEAESLIQIPDLMGFSKEEAENIASSNGFSIGAISRIASLPSNRNIVIRQLPPPGSRVSRNNTTINIIIGE